MLQLLGFVNLDKALLPFLLFTVYFSVVLKYSGMRCVFFFLIKDKKNPVHAHDSILLVTSKNLLSFTSVKIIEMKISKNT